MYYIDQARQKPYLYSVSMPFPNYWYYQAGNLSNRPPQTVTVQVPSGPPLLGFGSRHAMSMNVLMCDGSVRTYRYGVPGLGVLIGRDDGQLSNLPE
jgi:prepilin-type processing-associated H-X9-DG protein